MLHMIRSRTLVALALLTITGIASSQTRHQSETFSIRGYTGQANVIRSRSRVLVDVEDLATITKGALSFERDGIILTPTPGCALESTPDITGKRGFSPAFTRAAIEAMASIREWGGILQVMVQNGYPVDKAVSGNTIRAYEGRAGDNVGLAASAVSTDSDYRGIELLRNEFNNVQTWSDSFVDARNSMSAADLSTSENPFKDDPEAQKIIHCGQFLAQMFASGNFQDDAACH